MTSQKLVLRVIKSWVWPANETSGSMSYVYKKMRKPKSKREDINLWYSDDLPFGTLNLVTTVKLWRVNSGKELLAEGVLVEVIG